MCIIGAREVGEGGVGRTHGVEGTLLNMNAFVDFFLFWSLLKDYLCFLLDVQ